LKRVGPVALILAWFLYLIHRAFYETFNVDDITNLIFPWLRGYSTLIKGSILFWTGAIRPLGGLFYLLIYQFAGFWSVPFRIAAIALLLLNLVLLYAVFRRLAQPLGFAVVALLFVCYNADMSDMYMSTGTVYDTLALTFTLLALLCDMQERPRWILAAIFTIAAVDAKEMGVAIPGIILAYEVVVRRKVKLAAVISTGLVSFAFLISRLAVKNELSAMPAYQLTVTWHRYLETTTAYLNNAIVGGHMSAGISISILLIALALSLALRNRLMLFGWCYYLVAVLPMSFATPRAGYAVYVPYAGVAIFIAALIYDRHWRRFAPVLAGVAICAIAASQYAQARYLQKNDLGHAGGQSTVRLTADGVSKLAPSLPRGARLLLINDPFEKDEELPHSTLRLRYRDPALSTTKLAWKKGPGKIPYPGGPFDRVFLFAGDSVLELPNTPSEMPAAEHVTMNSKLADLSIVKEIGTSDGSPNRWVNQDPELLFKVPNYPAHFEMAYLVPGVILDQTKTLEIDAWIADSPAPSIHITEAKDYTYRAALLSTLKPGDTASVRFHVRNPYVSKGDGVKLAFLLTSAGFVHD